VTYTVYNDSACASGTAVNAGTKAVANGSVAPSDAISFENAGQAYWRAGGLRLRLGNALRWLARPHW